MVGPVLTGFTSILNGRSANPHPSMSWHLDSSLDIQWLTTLPHSQGLFSQSLKYCSTLGVSCQVMVSWPILTLFAHPQILACLCHVSFLLIVRPTGPHAHLNVAISEPRMLTMSSFWFIRDPVPFHLGLVPALDFATLWLAHMWNTASTNSLIRVGIDPLLVMTTQKLKIFQFCFDLLQCQTEPLSQCEWARCGTSSPQLAH